jgi:SAM-dependent methyltransferase
VPEAQHPPQRSIAGTRAVVVEMERLAAACRDRMGRPIDVLDLGGGTGGVAVPLAVASHRVTVVDPSPNALAALDGRARDAGVSDLITAIQGDGDSLAAVLPGRTFDLVCCHGTLEFVDDPAATLHSVADVLLPGGVLSLIVSGRLAVVFAKALAGEFAQAKAAITDPAGRWGPQDPLPRRFDLDELQTLLTESGFTVEQARGVGILTHLVPASFIDSDADRAALDELDELLVSGTGRDFLRTLGSALHVVARLD